jgi:hypothetical protein
MLMMRNQNTSRGPAAKIRTAGPHESSACCALIPLDTNRLRTAEYKKLKRAKATYAKLETQWTFHEKEEKRSFLSWVRTHCGPNFEKVQSLDQEYQLLERTLFLAESLSFTYPARPLHECADAAVAYYESGGVPPKGFEDFFKDPNDGDEDSPHSRHDGDEDDEEFRFERDFEFDDDDDPFDEMLEGLFGDRFTDDPEDDDAAHERTQRLNQRIKELYRKIARRLHPDQAGSADPDQLKLWYEAQSAYEHHDIGELERIDAHCDLLTPETTKTAPVSSIQSGIAFFKKAATRLRRVIRQAKRGPEWGFLTWSDTKKKRVLASELKELNKLIRYRSMIRDETKAELDRIRRKPKTPTKRQQQKAPRRPQRHQSHHQPDLDLF